MINRQNKPQHICKLATFVEDLCRYRCRQQSLFQWGNANEIWECQGTCHGDKAKKVKFRVFCVPFFFVAFYSFLVLHWQLYLGFWKGMTRLCRVCDALLIRTRRTSLLLKLCFTFHMWSVVWMDKTGSMRICTLQLHARNPHIMLDKKLCANTEV